jgi:adenosylcobinamide-phosphate synthase
MPVTATGAVALGFALDLVVAEPSTRFHPVAWFGRVVAPFDREWRRPRAVGVAVAAALPLLAAGTVALLTWGALEVNPIFGAAVAGLVVFVATSLRMLVETAREVVADTGDEGDLSAARERLPVLVGRDPSDLSAGEVRSAAVESAAENLADGLVAPLAAFAVLAPASLALAAGAAAWVKAVNTLDSMLGYRSKPVGWASARLDDAVMWLPARVSAGLVAAGGLAPRAVVAARAWADTPPSPNSGWPMATLAAALDVRLAKPGVYALNDGATLPTVSEAARGVRVVGVAGVIAYLLAGVVAWW